MANAVNKTSKVDDVVNSVNKVSIADDVAKIPKSEIATDVGEGGRASTIRVRETIPPNSMHSVKIYTDGNAQINTGKIDTYIRGKVKLNVDDVKSKIADLKLKKQSTPNEFTKTMQKELDTYVSRLHNYQRSQEMSNTLIKAGIEDTVENNQIIAENLMEAAKSVTTNNTEIISYIEGTNGKVQVVSRWKILNDGTPYLATIILKPVK